MQNETTKPGARLVVIADDITGAFDTGVQFHKYGAAVQVTTAMHLPEDLTAMDVLVIDAETRHASAQATYQTIGNLTRWVKARGVPHLYIKTDSALRGHVGMALRGALEASGCRLAAFAPAYPDMGRMTLHGRQMIDGEPLHRSVFGRDPFDPVQDSRIRDMLHLSGVAVREYPLDQPYDTCVDQPCVAVFDVVTNADFAPIVAHLKAHGQLALTAGCAAFASYLPEVLGLPRHPVPPPDTHGPLMVICGSLNPITRAQMAHGESAGCCHFSLAEEQLLQEAYWQSPEGRAWLGDVHQRIVREENILLDTGLQAPAAQTQDAALEEKGKQIAGRLGWLLRQMIRMDQAEKYMPMIIGGDTLMGFLAQMERMDVTLEGEVLPGVVQFAVQMDGRKVSMLSKSGGFGNKGLFTDILHLHAR